MKGKTKKIWGLIFGTAVFWSSCHPPTEQDRILALIKSIGKEVEKKDIPKVLFFLTEDYEDFEGRNKEETRSLVQNYFDRRRAIVVHLLFSRVQEIKEEKEAVLLTDAVLSSGGAEVLRRLVRFAGDFYRFRLELSKTEQGWKIRKARWESISVNDLFPESVPILKQWLPD